MSRLELLEVIRAALDCPSHFLPPTVINNDPDFDFGEPLVVCQRCVERMRAALGLRENEAVPASSELEHWFHLGEL